MIAPYGTTARTVPSKRSPSTAPAGSAEIRTRSGRIVTLARSPAGSECGRVRTIRSPATRTESADSTTPSMTLLSPRKFDTNSVSGASYSVPDAPTCSIRPARMIATRSDIDIASSWSCVT